MVSKVAFKKAVKQIGIGEWHDEYRGRYYHEGYAVLLESVPDYGRFIAGLSKDPSMAWLIAHDPHMPTLQAKR